MSAIKITNRTVLKSLSDHYFSKYIIDALEKFPQFRNEDEGTLIRLRAAANSIEKWLDEEVSIDEWIKLLKIQEEGR